MLESLGGLGYKVESLPPYTLVYKADMPELTGLIGALPLPGRESPVTGRAAIRIVEPGLVLRRLTHGGLLRSITGGRFLSLNRSLREISVSAHLASRGVPTPEIAALRFRRAGPFYAIEVITKLVPGAVDLLAYLEKRPADALLAFMQAGGLISRVHGLGVYHPDLHVKNILLDRRKALWIIDLDGARLFPALPPALRERNLSRFRRSLVKWDRAGRISLPAGWEQAFADGYAGGR